MRENQPARGDFRPDYAALELNYRDNWEAARNNYRRLVHVWHPDRYAQRPHQRQQAQHRFIQLTMAYNHLKNFQRQHGHLPYEPSPNEPDSEKKRRFTASTPHTQRCGETRVESMTEPADAFSSSLFSDDERTSGKTQTPVKKKRAIFLGWLLAGGSIVVLSISILVMLDKKSSQATQERGQAVLREAPESDFMPTPADIRRGEAKGAFFRPAQ